jgi:hypothetical protein
VLEIFYAFFGEEGGYGGGLGDVGAGGEAGGGEFEAEFFVRGEFGGIVVGQDAAAGIAGADKEDLFH